MFNSEDAVCTAAVLNQTGDEMGCAQNTYLFSVVVRKLVSTDFYSLQKQGRECCPPTPSSTPHVPPFA